MPTQPLVPIQRLVVGLGNPGPRYTGTRHSVGFEVVLRLADRLDAEVDASRFAGRFGTARLGLGDTAIGLLMPETLMNRSGQSVASAVDALGLAAPQLMVVLDDLDLPFGRLRLRPSGGPGGHNGLGSIIDALGSSDVPRLRFGIGRPPQGIDPVEYVLDPFSDEERKQLPGRIAAAADALVLALEVGVTEAMNRVNRLMPDEPEGGAKSGEAAVEREPS